MDVTQVFLIMLSSIFVNNFVMSRFLGICPFLGVSKKIETALGMGVAVIFVMALASATTYIVYNYVLSLLNIEFLYNIAFILIIASLVQLVEMFLKKSNPSLYQALGVYLPLITTNCAVLGVCVINKDTPSFGFIAAVFNGIFAAVGFTLAIVLFAGIRERIERNNILPHFLGFPIALITAGLMSIAFLGFAVQLPL
ncbi:MAG: RnfABCDGE type electron transport complex subunit A [Clostridiales bacterium]|jgi:electron transport complex protein RnfA|nr:RnfABCDGE type electron transport complex subunit A [Clostridiales bacterium]